MQAKAPISILTCSIDMRFSPSDVERGLELLRSSLGFTEASPGCQACSVAHDAVDATRIHYRESWSSEADFQRHTRSEEFRRVLLTMDLCSEEPQVVIGNFSGHSGLTYLQKLCDRQETRD